MSKIALALIVAGTNEESVFLDQCLENVSPYVDGVFVTSTYKKGQKPNNEINKVCAKYKANVSYFEWVDDFSAARNFNFKQVPKDYEYILWCDADDIFVGLQNLKGILEENKDVDAFGLDYIYALDEFNNPIDIHKKTQIVRNDGCVEWQNRIHENFKENRSLRMYFIKDKVLVRIHKATETHLAESRERNLVIAKKELKERANDPTSYFNYGNSLMGVGKYAEARKAYLTFLEQSQSDDEKYLVYQRLSGVERTLGNNKAAIRYLQTAIGSMITVPDAYLNLGYLYSDLDDLDNAEMYLMKGLLTKPNYAKMLVYNPRDYDVKPMNALAKVYLNKARPDLALPMLKGCLEINPESTELQMLVREMTKENDRLELVVKALEHIETLGDDKEKIAYTINKLPEDLQSHPAICRVRNKYFVKTESNGKEIAYYCGQTAHEWNPEMAKTKGIGGSEEAVINLSKEWTKMGYKVTVFNSCGHLPMECDGVGYKPFWYYNPQDKYDITVLWRRPNLADYEINTTKLFVDMHDVIPSGEFTEKRLARIDKVFVKTNAHRVLFPNIPDEKISIVPNGQDFGLFENVTNRVPVYKDPYLLVNTSSPERSMDVLPKLFKRVKERVPQARLKWAYGFEIFDNSHRDNPKMMEWKENCLREMQEAGIENCGRLSQVEAAKLYLEGRVLAYPSEFYEIDCISVKKAEACGCIPITSDFAAFKESNKYGVTIPSTKTIENWSKPYQFSFGIEDEKAQDAWVDAVVAELQAPMVEYREMKEWAKKFDWALIAPQWLK